MSNRCSIRTPRTFERAAQRHSAPVDTPSLAEHRAVLVQMRTTWLSVGVRVNSTATLHPGRAGVHGGIGAGICLRGRRKERMQVPFSATLRTRPSAHAEVARPCRLLVSEDYKIKATFLAILGRIPAASRLILLAGDVSRLRVTVASRATAQIGATYDTRVRIPLTPFVPRAAQRTARAAIYCSLFPPRFSTSLSPPQLRDPLLQAPWSSLSEHT